ncbi:hypothetical protein [uncultured Spirosoma sp.]|uniref:hypothetical protein n=1 Tax=uncultured Spirosoma sp. TaxID=278208 RepID=UPI0025833BB7|nr:hypothetical protein [uncultured Spirosoma sp.]
MTALQELVEMDLEFKRQKHPGVPPKYVPKTKFEDKTANGLTKCITRCVELHGGYATRIQSQGQYNEQLGRWTKGTTRKGTADIHAVYNGRHLSVEVKIGKDRMSDAQRRTARQVEQAGGIYYAASTYEGFWNWFRTLAPTCTTKTTEGDEQS